MRESVRLRHAPWAVVSIIALAAAALGQEYTISRSTVDGGGVMRSTGGDLELSGTIGQADAGVLTGGAFELTGGFWFGIPPCDGNDDGLVTSLDYEALAGCLSGPGGNAPAGSCRVFDCNPNGTVALDDFSKLQVNYTGQ